MNETGKRRSGIQIMGQLIGLVKPLWHIMLAAVVLGTAGYLCAIFLTVLAGVTVWQWLSGNVQATGLLAALVVLAVLRGLLHYAEQYCNHFIAFKLLAIIRHKVFAALRRLCPAKLEGRDKGNLISIITTDIELLEVFYAHTISPIAIAVLTSFFMVCFIGHYHIATGAFALCFYLAVGLVIPLWNGRCGAGRGMAFRNAFGELNSFVLESLRGLDETIQYGYGTKREEEMKARSVELGKLQRELSRMEESQRAVTNLTILVASFGMLFLTLHLYRSGSIGFDGVLIGTIAMMGSFGPVVALSSLSNNLNQTLASGERVISILEETPLVAEVPDTVKTDVLADVPSDSVRMAREEENSGRDAGQTVDFSGARAEHVTFAYEDEVILKDYSVDLKAGKIIGIHGASGSGKSTLLKLLMRFWDVDRGRILVNDREIQTIPTRTLRDTESYVTQETHLFHDSIANNIAIGKPGATSAEIQEAAKKASIHDFIMALPKGYETEVGELGDTLSGGEKQRIGIARAFLHDAPLLLLDEPTSNLDSLNEGIILKSIRESCEHKTVVLVSHRVSTMNVADIVYEMENGRVS